MKWIRLVSFCISLMVVLGPALPQTAVTPTPEQLEQLEKLTPQQRQAVLEILLNRQRVPELEEAELPEELIPPEELEPEEEPPELVEELRIEGDDTLVIEFILKEDLEVTDLADIVQDPRLSKLEGARAYSLDRFGVLELPGIARIPLAGLTAEEVATRVAAERDLRYFDLTVTILPLVPTGTAALQPFGYDLFEDVPTTFAPVTDVPVPSDYVIGPGDTVNVQLFGNQNAEYDFVVNRNGQITFPELGPVVVAGMEFAELKEVIQTRVREQMIGVRASVTMGELRSIRVFVLGDAERPGSYTVSGLSTITNALFQSGGIKTIGSLRNIQLKRNGNVIQTLDLYDLLLRGDTTADQRLQPGDVIFVPPIGRTGGADGEVRRPAIYELKNERTVEELVAVAGGLMPSAYPEGSILERITPDRQKTVVAVDLTTDAGQATKVLSGDILRVYPVLEEVRRSVSLAGHVFRAGTYQWQEGMRLTDLLPTAALLKPGADAHYLLIRREHLPERRIEALSADLAAALNDPSSAENVELQALDQITVFNRKVGRTGTVGPLLDELRLYGSYDDPVKEVVVGGRVRAPGSYPLETDMRVSDLIRAGGGLDEAAYVLEAELTRYAVTDGQMRQTELIPIDLQQVLAGDPAADTQLVAHDYLSIKEIPQWQQKEQVELVGRVRFPGVYPIKPGEGLRSVLERAGGLTDLAFSDGAVFTREELRRREREQLDQLATRLERDLASLSLQSIDDPNAQQALSVGQSLLTQLRATEPVGRLVVDVERLRRDPSLDIVMKDGDTLYIPQKTQAVTVIGEVQYTTSHIYDSSLNRDDYIGLSGGLTASADRKRIYVVRANGAVITGGRSAWYRRGTGLQIAPGDTIVVPLDADRVRPLTLWTSITQILYNLAIAVAAVNAITN